MTAVGRALLSVGIDIGTSTTQLILSRLHVQNTAAAFAVPRLAITRREIVYRSGIHTTPLRSETVIDARGVEAIVAAEYRRAAVDRSAIETGAVIITGETARKENARQVLAALAGFAGDFVVATAGPALEGVLAARGAGCDVYAAEHGAAVLNFDIGGGTANGCLFDRETCAGTGCLNVGGRLVKLEPDGTVAYVSPVLSGLSPPAVGRRVTAEDLTPLCRRLAEALEEAAGLRPRTDLSRRLATDRLPPLPPPGALLSFSGGVADLIDADPTPPWLAYGDIGVLLGRAIGQSALGAAPRFRPRETIRATVVGAGSHATSLSGSTIAYEGVEFPLKNLPVLALSPAEEALASPALAEAVGRKLTWFAREGGPVVLALRGLPSPGFDDIQRLAEGLLAGLAPLREAGLPLIVATARDMAKALGQAMLCRLPRPRRLLALDGLELADGSYLDIGRPVGSALPVVIKTLLFQ